MKKDDNDFEAAVRKALRGKKVPVLVLDQRWHMLFPKGEKPSEILALEEQVNELLKRQGFLVNDLKALKKSKRKLMEGIVSGMGEEGSNGDKKKKNQQRLLLEIKERIQEESDELMDLPHQITHVNEELLIVGAAYSFERLENGDSQLQELSQQIHHLEEVLDEKKEYKADIEESMGSAYELMHGLMGHDIMNLYDRRKGQQP